MAMAIDTTEEEKLRAYKVAAYQELGFTEYESRRLCDVPGLDIGTVRQQINRGCPVKVAYRIYRP